MPTMKQLKYFVSVVDRGSISRAADQLHVAQTAVGLQIRALEQRLGTDLLLRTARGVEPTPAGRYVRARQLIRGVDALVGDVARQFAGATREISLGMSASVMRRIGTRAVLNERKELPGIHLHLVEANREQLVTGLRCRDFDYIFTHDIEADGLVCAVPLLRQSLVLVSRPARERPPGPVRFADAVAGDIVVRGHSSHVLEVVQQRAAERGLTLRIAYEIDSLDAVKQLIRQSDTSAFMTAELVAEELQRGELEAREIRDPRLEMTLHFAMRCAEPPSEAERPLLEYLDTLVDDFCRQETGSHQRLGHLASLVSPRFSGAAQ